jgi:hypothetical protein
MSLEESTSTNEFREIPGFPGYRINQRGDLESCRGIGGKDKGKLTGVWRPSKSYMDSSGYRCLTLRSNGRYVHLRLHRAILMAFVGPPPNPQYQGRHLNDDRTNNTLGNLAWGTAKDNAEDKIRNGRNNNGEKNGGAKLTEANVIEIFTLKASGLKAREIATRFGIHWVHVYRILRGEKWKKNR